jgi:hypothetical protein
MAWRQQNNEIKSPRRRGFVGQGKCLMIKQHPIAMSYSECGREEKHKDPEGRRPLRKIKISR